MIRTTYRALLAVLCSAALAGGMLAQLALTADPVSAATPISSFSVASTDLTSVFGQSVTFGVSLTGSSGAPTGTIDVLDGAIPICSAVPVENNVAEIAGAACATSNLSVGTHTISATYSGDATYNADASTTFQPGISQVVSPASTTTAVSPSANPSVAGAPVTFTATVAPVSPGAGTLTGTVEFQSDTVDIVGCSAQALASGQAVCTTSLLPVGAHDITATYSGDADFATSTSNPVTQNVNRIATTTTLSPAPSPNPSVFSGPVVISATVASGSGTPTGTVAFKDGGFDISGCSAQPLSSGVATCTTAFSTVDAQDLTASYAASGNFAGSDSAVTTQNVNQAATSSAVVSNHPSATWNQPVTFTATISAVSPATATPALGTVAFNADGVAIEGCTAKTLTAGVATCTADADPVGTASITAVFSGDASFTTSTSSPITQIVTKATTGTALAADHDPSRSGQSVTFTATVTSTAGTPTGTVTFSRVKSDSSLESLGTRALTAGVATLTTSTLPVENGHIVAAYNTTTHFSASTVNVAHRCPGVRAGR